MTGLRLRSFFVAASFATMALAIGAATVAGCNHDATTSPTTLNAEAGGGADDGSAADGAGAGASVGDAGAQGVACSFNRDCQPALRCECSETTGCACQPGVRGTGKNGVDPCTTGNACTSALCVEGPGDAGSFCSDECSTSADCKGPLPLCSTVAGVGRVCIRQD